MIIKREENLIDFEFWGGAKGNAEMLTHEQLEEIEKELEYLYSEGMTETQINELFWFDFAWVCEIIGLEYDEANDEIITN